MPALIGAALAFVCFLAVLLDGHATLLGRDSIGGFYDLQAHSFWDLRLDVPAKAFGFEAFLIDGKAYTYYGPWPAVLRMPVTLFTHSFDGRLTQVSMLLAFSVALVFTFRLTQRIGRLVRSGESVAMGERIAVGAFLFVVGAGSTFLFLASRAFVYHEAELWGAALAIAAFDSIVAFATSAERRDLLWAVTFTLLAFLTRASVGAGPVAALALILLASFSTRGRLLAGLPQRFADSAVRLRLAIGVAVPVIAYAAINYARFGTLFSIPLDRQQFTQVNAVRQAALAANGGSLFGLKFVPTTLLAVLRPDAFRFDALIPWINFPPPATVIGGVTFDTLDVSSSLPASMPALVLLAIVGLAALVRPPATGAATLAVLRAPVVGAAAGTFVTLTIAFIAQRYLSDFVPLLVLLGAAGLHIVLRWSYSRPRRTVAVGGAWAVLAVAALGSVWVNGSLAILYQRQLNPAVTEAELSDFVDFQYRTHARFPGGTPPSIERGPELPPSPRPRGTVFVVGECRGLYFSTGGAWRALERTETTGGWKLDVRFSDSPTRRWQPLVSSGTPGAGNFVAARVLPDDQVVFGYFAEGQTDTWIQGSPVDLPPGRRAVLDVVDDTRTGRVEVAMDGAVAFDTSTLVRPTIDPTIGGSDVGGPVARRFDGDVAQLRIHPDLCESIIH